MGTTSGRPCGAVLIREGWGVQRRIPNSSTKPAAKPHLLQEGIPVAFTDSRGSWNVGLDGLCFRVGLGFG